MKNKILKYFSAIFFIFFPIFFFSCASSKSSESEKLEQNLNHSFRDGIYEFSSFYTLETHDFFPPETEFNIKIDKNSYGNAVFIKNSTFLEPEFKFPVLINDDFSVSSPENISVSGSAEKDGRIHFSALVEQNGKTYLLTEHCLVLWHGTGNENLLKKFDGKYSLKSASSDEKLEFDVAGGIYKGNFQGTVNSDGTFYNGYTQTTEISMGKFGSSFTSVDFKEVGVFSTGGGLDLKSVLTTNTGISSTEAQNIYSSTNVSSIQKETPESLLSQKGKPIYSPYKSDKNMPKWYEFGVKSDKNYYYACGTASKNDKETAMELAKIYALGEISAMKKTEISSNTKISTKKQGKENSGKEFAQSSSSSTKINSSCEILEEFFDEKHGNAYTKIKVKR